MASVTKLFVSVLLLAKVNDGAARLNHTARAILGDELPAMMVHDGATDYTDRITLEQLLRHRSGMPNPWQAHPAGNPSCFALGEVLVSLAVLPLFSPRCLLCLGFLGRWLHRRWWRSP